MTQPTCVGISFSLPVAEFICWISTRHSTLWQNPIAAGKTQCDMLRRPIWFYKFFRTVLATALFSKHITRRITWLVGSFNPKKNKSLGFIIPFLWLRTNETTNGITQNESRLLVGMMILDCKGQKFQSVFVLCLGNQAREVLLCTPQMWPHQEGNHYILVQRSILLRTVNYSIRFWTHYKHQIQNLVRWQLCTQDSSLVKTQRRWFWRFP
jgi:hypothetical protein